MPRQYDLRAIAARAMRSRGLLPAFSEAVLKEINAQTNAATERGADIRDLRDLPWVSIDNDDSRDLDQLTVSQPFTADAVKILVAIADVDALVAEHSATDRHAQTNTTSVYTVAEVFPMLPDKLCYDLTSLVQDETRLAVVVEMAVGYDGTVRDSDVYRAHVRNHAKLAYDAVAAWLDGKAPSPSALRDDQVLQEQLRLQDRVAQAMKKLRHQHGALTLESIEPRASFVGDVMTDLKPVEKNRATELIEDFMIAANSATARYLDSRQMPSLRRILRTPKRWDRIVSLAAQYGAVLPALPDAAALQTFLITRREADPDRFPDISLSVVKLLGSGEYALDDGGQSDQKHFGLAVKDYTHSTAPNRRFPDLITQRLVKAAIAGQRPRYARDELASLAQHCTRQEDNAAKVERQVRKSAAALLLASRIGEEFDGIVTGAADKGTWVRISGPSAEGRVVRGFEGMDVGDRVRVRLVRTDVEQGYIDFARVEQHG